MIFEAVVLIRVLLVVKSLTGKVETVDEVSFPLTYVVEKIEAVLACCLLDVINKVVGHVLEFRFNIIQTQPAKLVHTPKKLNNAVCTIQKKQTHFTSVC